MKITVIGAGSTYTPELVNGFHHVREHLQVDDLFLMDISRDRLDNVGAFAKRIIAKQALNINVVLTEDLEEAIRDADAVLVQIRVGGQAMRALDEKIPLAFNQVGQETTGAGGAMKALRTVPVVLHIAETMKRIAKPDAWLIDFTNPVGIVTRALLDGGHRAVGLCNYAIGVQRWASSLLGVEPHQVEVNPAGLNHFSWTRSITLDGREVLPEIIEHHGPAVEEKFGFPLPLLKLVGALPSYYLKWYYDTTAMVERLKHEQPRAEAVAAIEGTLLEMYRDTSLTERPAELEKRGGAYYSEAAAELLASLLGGAPGRHVINVRNNGLIPGLADDDVIETLCDVSRLSVSPVAQEPLPPHMLGPVQHVLAYERQIADAAISGDVDTVRRGLLTHPLMGEYDCVEHMLPELLEASKEYLPAFREGDA